MKGGDFSSSVLSQQANPTPTLPTPYPIPSLPQNPNGAYMEFSFPDALMDGGTGEFCGINFETCPPALPNQTQSVLLGSRDAILFLGCTPPPSRFFSDDMLVSSCFTNDDFYYFFPGCPFGDTKNSLNTKDFDLASPLALLQTFNEKTADLVESSLPSSLSSHFDIHKLNSTLLRLYDDKTESYLDSQPDALRPLARWSMPLSPIDSDEVSTYTNQVWPVLYIRSKEAEPDKTNLYKPIVTPRETGFSESEQYQKKFDALAKSVQSDLTSLKYNLISTTDADNYLPGEMDD